MTDTMRTVDIVNKIVKSFLFLLLQCSYSRRKKNLDRV